MRRTGQRLRTRIVVTTALVSAIAMAAMIVAVLLALNYVNRKSVDSALDDRLSVLSSGIASNAEGPSQALETVDDAIDDTTWLYAADGSLLDGPDANKRVQRVADSLRDVSEKKRVKHHERVYVAAPVEIRGPDAGRGVLVVSKSLDPYESTRNEIIIGLVALGLLVTAGATGIAAWTMQRTLRPVEAMAALADDWSERAMDARFDDLGTGDEIDHLGRTLNVLLDRVAGALRGEQLLTAELAHELRTPLTGIRGEAELALMRSPTGPAAEHLGRVVDLADQMTATIGTLLAMARSDGYSGTRTTLGDVTRAATAAHPAGHPPVRVEITDDDLGVSLAATTDLAARALSPIIDNAIRYAATAVTVTCEVAERSVDLHVSDDGPGLEGEIETVFEAGTRDPGSPGAGLGLALSRRVAGTLGGRVTVTSMTRPTTFTLTLPRT